MMTSEFQELISSLITKVNNLERIIADLVGQEGTPADEAAQDAVGAILTDTATIDFTYTDATPSITADVKDGSITFAKMQDIATDKLLGRATASTGDIELITLTAFARTLIDDVNAAAGRVTLDAVGLTGNETIAGIKTFSAQAKFDSSLLISPGGTQDYLVGDDGADALTLQSQGAAKSFDLRMFTQDADGTDNVILTLWAVGKTGSTANRERLIFGYLAASSAFEFQSEAQGTGTLRPIIIYVEGNANQLRLATNGNVGFGVDPIAKLHAEQASTTAAIPVLRLKQADLSEEFIRFESTVGAGNPIDTAAAGARYGKFRVYVEGVGIKFVELYNP